MDSLVKRSTDISNCSLVASHAASLTAVEHTWSSTLPNETLSAIFLSLSPAALTAIARVCRQWRAVAEWILYAGVFINETLSTSSPFPYNTLRCCQTIISHPHLASGLKRFHIRWISDHGDYYDPYLEIILSNLSQAISSAINIESLDLYLGLPSLPEYPISTSLVFPIGDVPFNSLRQISLNGIGHFAHNRLTHFLNFVPSIQHLRLPDYRDQMVLLPNALPSLVSFCGSPRAAATVLPGRPVQSLALIGQDYVTDLDLSRMAMTSIPLRHLDLSAMSVTPILLRNVSRNLSMVESLKVKLALRHTLHFALSGIRLLEALSHLLGAFYRLSTLDLSPTHVDYTGLSNGAEELSLCQSWQGACPSLRRIVFPSQTEWSFYEERRTWVPVLPEGSRRRPAFYSSSTTKKYLGS
ncbi:hypothetical protein HYDPIDRAFT_111062 [Hydnomerulius pinastri MD-312]|uniref:F-box domain-containing protein n=1 Tax=Hydnomerulius pinastri MD-312 TaxID=994086 RepID=A0A0C9WGC1_9AGAM|nr:hypothetical protein HYDPIDRAFT_111062 [Hydnomerulius pinastri MD-312]